VGGARLHAARVRHPLDHEAVSFDCFFFRILYKPKMGQKIINISAISKKIPHFL
jgi:hypothetical protein